MDARIENGEKSTAIVLIIYGFGHRQRRHRDQPCVVIIATTSVIPAIVVVVVVVVIVVAVIPAVIPEDFIKIGHRFFFPKTNKSSDFH